MNTNTPNPYIGPRSFTRWEGNRFYGREIEARDLLSLVIAKRLVLFYAQSGAGKTSLLNTRLIPGLEANGRAVLPVGRVSGDLPEGIDDVENIFAFNLMQHLDQGDDRIEDFTRLHLTGFLRNLVSEDGKTYIYDPTGAEDGSENVDGPICVLIIDQFEEILTTHPDRWQERTSFFRQLNQAMQDDPKLSVVLSLREDYAAALEPYAPLMADRMRARFYMERMGHEAALAAIAEPAAKVVRPFAPGAAELLAENLSMVRCSRNREARPGQYIEPVQLQVVCWQLWQNLAEGETITAADVESAGNIDHALADFYEQALADTVRQTKVSELELRQWFDRRLITEAGTRGTVFQGKEMTGGMENRVVRLLEDRFLLRAESRSGAVWYELIHDHFVKPIIEANRAWLEVQGPLLRDAVAWDDGRRQDKSLLYTGERLEKTLAELDSESLPGTAVREFLAAGRAEQVSIEEKEAARQAEERRKQRSIILLSLGLMIAIVLSLVAFSQWRKAEAARQQAEYQKEQADIARQQAEDTQQVVKQQKDIVMRLFSRVNTEMIPALQKITGTEKIIREILQENFDIFNQVYQLSEGMGEASQQEKALSIIMLGDSYVGIGSKRNALALYNQALEIQQNLVAQAPDNAQAQTELANIKNRIEVAENLEDTERIPDRREEFLQRYQQTLEIWKLLADDNPGSRGAQWNLAISYNRLGEILIRSDREKDALEQYKLAFDIWKGLTDKEPDNLEAQRELAASYDNVGHAEFRLGNKKEALGQHRKAFDIWKGLSGKEPDNLEVQRNLADSFNRMGHILSRLVREDEALKQYELAVDQYKKVVKALQRLAEDQPGNLEVRKDLQHTYNRMNIVLKRLGRDEEAVEQSRQYLEFLKRLDAADSDNAEAERDQEE